MAKNVLGGELAVCGKDPMTGWFRNGCCDTDGQDVGVHTVCAVVTREFLDYTAAQGNDLCTATPWFPGLKAGDRWCLCAGRWLEAYQAGVAPAVVLEATHEATLETVPLEALVQHAFRVQ